MEVKAHTIHKSKKEGGKFWGTLKKYFFTGLVAVAPIVITIIVLWWLFTRLDSILGRFFYLVLGIKIPGLGILAMFVLMVLIGWFTRRYIGRTLLKLMDQIFARIPVARTIYSTVKQLGEFVQQKRQFVFNSAVLLEYPRKGIWTIGFLSSSEPVVMDRKELYPVFVPTTPNPTSGFLVYLSRKEFKVLDISVVDAMKIIVSAGMLSKVAQEEELPSEGGNDTAD